MKPLACYARIATCAGALVLAATSGAYGQTPYDFVRQADFECRRAEGPAPVQELRIRQLNPVLQGLLPNQKAELGALEEVCVPVSKNFQTPSEPALGFISWVDTACYRARADAVDVEVDLSHLNPVLQNLPHETVTLRGLAQVCLPVSKNNAVPQGQAVRQLTRHFDLACYDLEEDTSYANLNLWLSHLNPVIQGMGHPPHVVHMERGRRLCVPIAKEEQPVPTEVLPYIRWSDFLKYSIRPLTPYAPIQLGLRHINPLFAGVDPFPTLLHGFNPQNPGPKPSLMVPVAKDGQIPPGGD